MSAVLTTALVAAGAGAAWATYCRARHGLEIQGDEVHHVRTADGWRIALSRYRPQSLNGRPLGLPVILCPGLSSNRVTFDLGVDPRRESASLARRLRTEGYDVWTLELRGHGLSDRPRWRSGRKWGYSFDDYLKLDMVAAIDAVLAATGAPRAHWLGHSMGGILLYAYLSEFGGEKLQSGITVASSLDYSRSSSRYHVLRRGVGLASVLPAIPIGPLLFATAPLAARFKVPPFDWLDAFNANPLNVDPELYRRLCVNNFHSVSSAVVAQLSTLFEPGGLRAWGGSRKPYLPGLASAGRVPVLAIGGGVDVQCPPEAVRATVAAFPPGACRERVFQRYGHYDLLMGRNADREVFPSILDWLAETSV